MPLVWVWKYQERGGVTKLRYRQERTYAQWLRIGRPRARSQIEQGQSLWRAAKTWHKGELTRYTFPQDARPGRNNRQLTADFGKLLAVVLMAAEEAPVAKPVSSKHIISMAKEVGEMDVSVPIPLSYMRCNPEYPPRRHKEAPMSGIRAPFVSTKRPSRGAETVPPTGVCQNGCLPSRLRNVTISSETHDIDLGM